MKVQSNNGRIGTKLSPVKASYGNSTALSDDKRKRASEFVGGGEPYSKRKKKETPKDSKKPKKEPKKLEDADILARDMAEFNLWDDHDKELMKYASMDFDASGASYALTDMGENAARKELDAKYGEKRVGELVESYKRNRNAEIAKQAEESSRKAVDKYGAGLATVAAVPVNVFGGLAGTLDMVGQMINGRDERYKSADPNSGGMLASKWAEGVYGAVRNDIADGTDVEKVNAQNAEIERKSQEISSYLDGVANTTASGYGAMAQSGKFKGPGARQTTEKERELIASAYSGAVSAMESTFRTALSSLLGLPPKSEKAISLGIAGLQALQSAYSDASARGASPKRAAVYATGVAFGEVASELIPFGKAFDLWKGGGAKTFRSLAKTVGEIWGFDFAGEEVNNIAGNWWDAVVMQDMSHDSITIGDMIANGSTAEEAKEAISKQHWKEAKDTAVSTLASSIFGGGTGQILGSAMYGNNQQQETAEAQAEPVRTAEEIPVQPTVNEEPAVPVQQEAPVAPVAPEAPATPVAPVAPIAPAVPVTPVTPAAPETLVLSPIEQAYRPEEVRPAPVPTPTPTPTPASVPAPTPAPAPAPTQQQAEDITAEELADSLPDLTAEEITAFLESEAERKRLQDEASKLWEEDQRSGKKRPSRKTREAMKKAAEANSHSEIMQKLDDAFSEADLRTWENATDEDWAAVKRLDGERKLLDAIRSGRYQRSATAVQASTEQNAEAIPSAAPAQQEAQSETALEAAVEIVANGGTISNKTAEAILADPQSVEQMAEAGAEIPEGTMSQMRNAVKDFVQQQAETVSEDTGIANAEIVAEVAEAPVQEEVPVQSYIEEGYGDVPADNGPLNPIEEAAREINRSNSMEAKPKTETTGEKAMRAKQEYRNEKQREIDVAKSPEELIDEASQYVEGDSFLPEHKIERLRMAELEELAMAKSYDEYFNDIENGISQKEASQKRDKFWELREKHHQAEYNYKNATLARMYYNLYSEYDYALKGYATQRGYEELKRTVGDYRNLESDGLDYLELLDYGEEGNGTLEGEAPVQEEAQPVEAQEPTAESIMEDVGAEINANNGVEPVGVMGRETSPESTVGAAESNFGSKDNLYNNLYEGNIQRDRPYDVRSNEIPKTIDGEKVSEFAGHSVKSKVTDDAMADKLEQLISAGRMNYKSRNTSEALDRNAQEIATNGIPATVREITEAIDKRQTGPDLEDKAWLLMQYYQDEGKYDDAGEMYVAFQKMLSSSSIGLSEAKRVFDSLVPAAQKYAWKRVAEQEGKKHGKNDVTVSDELLDELGDVANAKETAITDAKEELDKTAEHDSTEAAKEAVKKVLTPEEIGAEIGDRIKPTTENSGTPKQDDLYSAIMEFIKSKKAPKYRQGKKAQKAAAALAQYYGNREDFETAWHEARRRAEANLADDPEGLRIFRNFLDTGGMAQDVMDAGDQRSVSRKAVGELASATDIELSKLVSASLQDKEAALAKMQAFLIDNYGLDGKAASEAATQIQNAFWEEMAARQEKRLRSMFGREPTTKSDKGLMDKFRELYNTGAFTRHGLIKREALAKLFGHDDLTLSDELLQEYKNVSEARRSVVEQKIVDEIASQLPTTALDAANKWRYTAMLANPSTHAKNMFGNVGQFAIQHGLKGPIKALTESGAQMVLGKDKVHRTTALLSASNKADRERVAKAWNDYDTVAAEVSNGGKYDDAKSQVEQRKRAWKVKETRKNADKINKALGKAEALADKNTKLLEREDAIAGRLNYAFALASYMKANNLDTITDDARQYAIKQAQEATFHDDSYLYEKVKGIGQNKVARAVFPFIKTPANVTSRALEYSPLGFITGTIDLVKGAKDGDINATNALDKLAKAGAGSILWSVGAWAASQGLLRITGTGSDDEKEYEEMMGERDWTMNLFGDKVDARFLTPAVVPVLTGGALWEAYQNFTDGDGTWTDLINALYSVTDPIMSSSMLSSFDSLMYAIRSIDEPSGGALAGAITREIVKNYANQFIPTIIRRATTAADNTARVPYVDPDNPLSGWTQNLAGGIPGQRDKLLPKRDVWGNEFVYDATAEDTGLAGAILRTISPTRKSDIHETEIDGMLGDIMKAGYPAAPSRNTPKYVNIKTEDENGDEVSTKVRLTQEEYDKLDKEWRTKSYEYAKELADDETFQALTPELQSKALQTMYGYAMESTKADIIAEYDPNIANYLAESDDVKQSVVTHIVSDQITKALSKAANGDDPAQGVEALQKAMDLYGSLPQDAKDELYEDSRNAANLQKVVDSGVDLGTFQSLYRTYRDTGRKAKADKKDSQNEQWAARNWANTIDHAVQDGTISKKQADVLKDGYKYWQSIPADTDSYDRAVEVVGNVDVALDYANKYAELDHGPTRTGKTDGDRAYAIAMADGTDAEKDALYKGLLKPGQYKRLQKALDLGASYQDYGNALRAWYWTNSRTYDKSQEKAVKVRDLMEVGGFSQELAENWYGVLK